MPKRRGSSDEIEDDDDGGGDDTYETIDDDDVREFGEIASPYLTPYLYNRRFLDKQYGIRRDGGTFMIGNSAVSVDETSDITINGKRFRGTKELWEPLTRKNVITAVITTSDLKGYKHILEMTNAHLVRYEPGGDIQISRGSNFTKVISKLFPQRKRRGIKTALRQRWVTYYMARALYYDPDRPSAFSTLQKHVAASKSKSTKHGDIEAWLLKQDAYTMQRLVRKRFPRNPYKVTNLMDVWECDILDVRLSVNITITTNIC